jgi:hypothetical protein
VVVKVTTSLATADPLGLLTVAETVEVLAPVAGMVDGLAVRVTVFTGVGNVYESVTTTVGPADRF